MESLDVAREEVKQEHLPGLLIYIYKNGERVAVHEVADPRESIMRHFNTIATDGYHATVA
jgi:hypothetical protein